MESRVEEQRDMKRTLLQCKPAGAVHGPAGARPEVQSASARKLHCDSILFT